ncbi:MAG: hypothetical protein ACK557_21155, partial [Planctomycetota bacterium]
TGLRKEVGWDKSARVVFGFSGLDRGGSPPGGAATYLLGGPAPRLGLFVWKADLADWSHPTG